MPTVYCSAMDCEFNGNDGKCTAKTVALSYHNIMTAFDGRQVFAKCKTWQKSQAASDYKKMLSR